MQTCVLLSIKPEHAEKILRGEKQFEFRRVVFKSQTVRRIIIYASNPIKKVIGEFEVEIILSLEIERLWKKTMKHSGISRLFYDSYFEGKSIGHAIKVKKPKRYHQPLDLFFFKVERPPQSFMYLNS